jgi:hypothetical protein
VANGGWTRRAADGADVAGVVEVADAEEVMTRLQPLLHR